LAGIRDHNHDIVRSYTRYADGVHNDDIAKMMAALYLTLRGTVVMYYGEEIGMENNGRKAKTKCKTHRQAGLAAGKRKGWRTHADAVERQRQRGFSKVKPWLPVPATFKTHNVVSEQKDGNSS